MLAHQLLVLTCVQIPVIKDVCIFCLTRFHFASVHALRRPQRRLLTSTRALGRPPANAIAQKEEDGVQHSDSAWGDQPQQSLSGGWARTRTAAPSDLTPEEKVLRNALRKESRGERSNHSTTSLPSRENETTQGPRIKMHFSTRESTLRPPIERTQGPRIRQEFKPRGPPIESTQGANIFRHVVRDYAPSPPIDLTQQPSVDNLISQRGARTKLSQATRFPYRRTQQNGRLPNYAPAGASQVAHIVEGVDKNDGPRLSGEQALRQVLHKEADPKPDILVHRISHSPHTSSVPGYPSRRDISASMGTRREETARASPIQTQSTQRQNTQENASNAGLPEYRKARDAQLDHHISQSRANPVFQQGDWHCPSCARHNVKEDYECPSCQTIVPSATTEKQTEHAKHWKHVRRIGHDASPEQSQPERFSSQQRSRDPEAIAKARAIEREKMERMEKTKDGEFVGLRGQYETATSNATKTSHWDLETDESQAPDVGPSDASTTWSDWEKWRARSAKTPQKKGEQVIRDKSTNQEVADRFFKDRPRTGRLTGGWKRWEPPSAERQPSLEESSQRGPSDQADGSVRPSSFELEREHIVRRFEVSTRGEERRIRREPQEQDIARHTVYESTSMPYVRGNDRNRLRKSRKVISVYDEADEEDEERAARRMERKEQRKKAKASQKAAAPATPIYLPEFISVSNLAGVLKIRVEDFILKMKDLGFEETNNDHVLDAETAGLVAAEFNFEPIVEQAENQDLLPRPSAEDKSVLPPRPPVVTIMGHVDHGKTTLLDYLRKSSVAASEHGGITQHIGAFSVPMPGGRLVTFLDTPGHEAFLSMRQRGANVTDIVILVVAADDSVKPQTIEAIRHAQAARVPMIVAVNKIDKEDSNVERVKQDLARYSVEIEDYGGDTQVVCVSGKTGEGMEELEDAAVALADILDLRSETDGQAEGWVLEATTKKAGRVATVLVRRGTLRPGDIIVAGTSWARVRSLRNEAGVMLKFAGPGTPVEIDGWREQPAAGDEVLQAPDEQRAKAVIEYRLEAHERSQMATDMAAVNEARRLEQEKREEIERAANLSETNPDAAATSTEGEGGTSSTPSFQEVFFIVKADVSGSVEAVTDAVSALGNSEVRPHILRSGVGPITEFDLDHAAVAKGHIISFNTTVDGNIQRIAEAKDVKILDQSIIYRLVDDVKATLGEKLPDIVTQKVLGEAEIAQVFEINTKGRIRVPVAGCRVRNGVIGRNNRIRVLRGKEVVYDGLTLHDSPLCHKFCTDSNNARHALFPQECQEGRHGDAKGQRVRYGL